ncbi:MAG: hypothetical protein IT350_19845 [Deltaproteobacteria bacterium]|nr:hypothetical protein [Deltaproteobacteria bacterium]
MAKKYQAVFPDLVSRVKLGERPQELKPGVESPFIGGNLIIPPSLTNFGKEILIPGSIAGMLRGQRTDLTPADVVFGIALVVAGTVLNYEYARWRDGHGKDDKEDEPTPTPEPEPTPTDPPEDPPDDDGKEDDPHNPGSESLYPPLDGYLIPRVEQSASKFGVPLDSRTLSLALYIMEAAMLFPKNI